MTNISRSHSPRFTALFVLGIAHGGSTLLGRMLNMHTDVLCPGELLRLPDALRDPKQNCSCGQPIASCEVWRERCEAIPDKLLRDYRGWNVELLEKMAARESGKVLLDLSKTRAYRLARKWKDPRVGFIFMIRDPRGALRSHVASGGNLKARLKVHKKWSQRLEKFKQKVGDRAVTVYYEDLVADPKASLMRICEHANFEFSRKMLSPSDGCHHFVYSSTSSYRKDDNLLTLDERWRKELSQDHLDLISKTLGSLPLYRNRYLRLV